MKKVLTIIIIYIIASGIAASATQEYKVIKIIDGDTRHCVRRL